MYTSYPVPGRCRGSVVGTLLVWIVGALTLGGALFLWVVDHPSPDPGTPAEIQARTAPLGHLILAAPPPEVAASPGPQAEPSVGAGTGAAPAGQPSVPETDAGPAPEVAAVSPETGSVAPEAPAVEAVSAPIAEVPAAEVTTADTTAAVDTAPETPDSGAAATADQLPVAGRPSLVESGTDAADAMVEVAPDERPVAEGAEATSASAPPVPAGASAPPWNGALPTLRGAAEPPAVRPFPMVPSGPYGYGPYRMVPIYRPDLPGAPYQLIPMVPLGR